MADMSKLLVASGLVIMTSPLCFVAQAQDYVDVEAERAGRTSAAAPATSTAPTAPAPADPYARPPASDPYSVQPAQSYPATSYGVNSAPAGTAVVTSPAAPAAGGGDQNVGNLFLQVQQLQQEVMRLNGLVEEQANELRKLKDQSLERYVDLDKRLSAGGGAAPASSGGSGQVVKGSGASVSFGGGSEIPGEAEAYQSAYSLVRGQQFDQAVDAFNQFLRNYPDGKYAPNAHYWLGELYLVVQPQDLESSRQAFTLLLDRYPDNPKAADAMFKLGKVQYLKGNREKAREYLDRVIREYGNTNSSAVKLAKAFIDENY
jgi:tol-pal system protein YbgF